MRMIVRCDVYWLDCRVAFYVQATNSAANGVTFNNYLVNTHGGVFAANTFTPPFPAIYWLSYTVVSQNEARVNFSFVGFPQLPNNAIVKQHDVFVSFDTISREAMRQLSPANRISVTSTFSSYANR